LNDNEDNSFETTVFVKTKSKGILNSYLRKRKQMNKWCCEEVDLLDQKTIRRFSSNNAKKKKFLDMTKPN
jgi:hypothetical protein